MERIKRFFIESWRAKLVSLFIAVSIWYLIKSNLDGTGRESFPVPGTAPATTPRPSTGPALEDTLLGPLIPVPAPIPVPGGGTKG